VLSGRCLTVGREWRLSGSIDGHTQLDAQRITQALLVLADNAARHTRPGDDIAFGAATVGGAGGDVLRLSVSDSGTGVAAADRSRIFERFARGGSSRRSDGAGLGLAIAGAIAAAHGGTVELSAGIGSTARGHSGPGATFTIVIPHRMESARASEPPPREQHHATVVAKKPERAR
jgi:two-component system, OmpR family, sensor kinase